MSGLFVQTDPARRRYGLAAFIAVIAGVISAFVKWGTRSHHVAQSIYSVPHVMWTLAVSHKNKHLPYVLVRF